MRLRSAVITLLVLSALPAPAGAAPLLNELRVNVSGADEHWEYIEIAGQPGESLAGLSFVAIEGSGATARGAVDMVVNFSTACGGSACALGPSGLLLLQGVDGAYEVPTGTTEVTDAQLDNPGGGLENGSTTFLLISGSGAPNESTDHDSDNDGVLDTTFTSLWTVVDGVAFVENLAADAEYSVAQLVTPQPAAATRFPDDPTPSSAGAWYWGGQPEVGTPQSDLGYGSDRSANFPPGGILTPGRANVGDVDGDGVGDASDNCPQAANAAQENTDGAADGGDACDTDDDGDGVADASDNCALSPNPDQANLDGAADGGDACDGDDDNDGTIDAADNCPRVANTGQSNQDGDPQGDACDSDDDNDGIPDEQDVAPAPSPSPSPSPGPVAVARFTVERLRYRRPAIRAALRLPAAGRVRVTVSGLKVRALAFEVAEAGPRSAVLRLNRRALARVRAKRRLAVTVRIAFTPVGGVAQTERRRLVLRR